MNKLNELLNKIRDYKTKLENLPKASTMRTISREEFVLLLGGHSCFRKVPGITYQMDYSQLYHCESPQDENLVKEHLRKLYDITDKDSLIEFCLSRHFCHKHYEDFMTFWKNAPLFDISELNTDAKEHFENCKELARHFYPLLQEKGFYAWDFNENIGLCRIAAACSIISEDEFWEITDEWIKTIQVFYHSYKEYCISVLCGLTYEFACYEGMEAAEQILNIHIQISERLFDSEDGPWQINHWYKSKEREWAVLAAPNLRGMAYGCSISKKAIDNEHIGYMYREEPSAENMDVDSGWRFFYGDEDNTYSDNEETMTVVSLDTICNLQPKILAFLHAEPGRRFVWKDELGDLIEVV